ncbi:MAG: sugar phosphate isomerase/epimerase [Chloroflexi bacterium]|nr:sugar phosphate isomerase/epimerase [Chloroflexota bacterium]
MKIGCCCPLEQAEIAQAAGFDYLECPLVSLRAEEDDATFAPVLGQYRAAALPVWAFNIFLPGDLKVVGPHLESARIHRYVKTALARAQLVGAQLIVFGSGRSRMIPPDFPRTQAIAQLVEFLHRVADEAAINNMTVVLEPLNRKESNVLNSVPEAVELARLVKRLPIRVLADFYHMDEENEPLSHIREYQDWLAHIHVADTGRLAPGTGQYPYAIFAEELRQINYQGRVSVECSWGDFAAEGGPAVRFLRGVLG